MASEQFSNNPQSTLNGGIGSGDTMLVVNSASGFPSVPQFRLQIESELLLVTGVTGTTFAVSRGVESTTPAIHGDGTDVTGVLTAGALGGSSDAATTTPSLRTLGTGSQQACAGNDSRLSDSRAPSGSAGGDLSGSYPDPTVVNVNSVAFPASPTVNTVPVCTTTNQVTWEAVPNAALQNSSLTVNAGTGLTGGGAVALGSSTSLSVATNGITNSLAAQMAANTIKGNNTGSAANPADLTVAQVQSMLFPSGLVMAFAGATAPTGWLLCDGSAVSRTTYAALFTAIGTTYGAGNGTTTFNVPDGRSSALVGAGTGSGLSTRSCGQTGGEETHLLVTGEMPAHSHGPGGSGLSFLQIGATASLVNGASNNFTLLSSTASTGGGGAHNNMQPWWCASWIIKT